MVQTERWQRHLVHVRTFSSVLLQVRLRHATSASIILDNWTVRYALVKCAASISEHCFRTLWSTVAALLEVLVMHAFDDYTEIAQLSQSALSKFSAAFAGDQSKFSGSALGMQA